MSAANMLSWQGTTSPQRLSCKRSQKTLVAIQYALLVLSAADCAGAIYLLLGTGNEVTIAGASPILTAVSTNSDIHNLVNADKS